MATISIRSTSGSEAGQLELHDGVFGAPQNGVVVREALNAFMANQRQGTHATKTRAFVSGGGKKPYKQKGTGNARQGSTRAAQWRHGAIIFGPQPRDYREKLNKRKRQIAFRSVLSARLAEGKLMVVENLELAAPKTKSVVEMIDKLGISGKVLFVTLERNDQFLRAARNIPYVLVSVVCNLNVYDLLLADCVVFTREAIEAVQGNLEATAFVSVDVEQEEQS